MNIKVAKHKRVRTEPNYVYYVGRSNVNRYYGADHCLHALGNPFKMGPGGERAEVIAKYRVWLWQKLQAADPKVLKALETLERAYKRHGRLVLVCHCAPLACHADIIKACLEWRAKEAKHD